MWKHAPDVRAFVESAVAIARSRAGERWSAIEFGSYAMHDHDPRPIAVPNGCEVYVGVDWRPGPGVDLVSMNSAAPERLGEQRFDLALSLSALEHDPEWRETLGAMLAVLRPGGIAAITVPAAGWPAHEVDCAPLGGTFYECRTVEDVLGALSATGLVASIVRASEDPSVYGRRRTNIIVSRGSDPDGVPA